MFLRIALSLSAACLALAAPQVGRAANFAQDVDILVQNIDAHYWQNYTFTGDSPEARVMAGIMQRSGVECPTVLQGAIFPSEASGGFEADVLCDTNEFHQLDFSATRGDDKLYINGHKVNMLLNKPEEEKKDDGAGFGMGTLPGEESQ